MATKDPRALIQEAEDLVRKASGGFSLFGGKTEKWESAASLYTQAASAFRSRKQYREAAPTYEIAADIQQNKLNEPMDMANTLIEASKVYRVIEDENGEVPKDAALNAARVLQKAIDYYTSTGNFRRAATHEQALAEVYELLVKDRKKAIEAYNTAAEWFESDNAEALANKWYLKVAELSALEGDYPRAIERFESVAKSSIRNQLMKWSVKEYLFKAGLCHLAVGDIIATRRALQQYQEMDNSFSQQRECHLLNDLVQCQEDGEPDQFTEKAYFFDKMSKLDAWKSGLLVEGRNTITKQEEDIDFS